MLMENADLNMITLQEASIKKRSQIDFSKHSFTDQEKFIIAKEVEIIKDKYPNYVPILVRARGDLKLTKFKYLVGGEITFGQFLFILRKKMNGLRSSEALFLFVDNALPVSSRSLMSMYNEKKDPELNMLIVTVCKENTFGAGLTAPARPI
jgi:GABA(A) receptor-associated protein